jgi:hypothetical protein
VVRTFSLPTIKDSFLFTEQCFMETLEVSKYLLQHSYAITRFLPLHELVEDLTWIGDPYSDDVPPLRYALRHDVLHMDDVVEIIEYLVDRDPTLLSARDEDSLLPLHLACRRGISFPIVRRNPTLLNSRDQGGASFSIVQSLVNLNKSSVKSVTSEGDLPLFLACEVPEPFLDMITPEPPFPVCEIPQPSLGIILLLIKLYPESILA